ncbi:MAG: AMP-binding protein, partial [Pseudomonadota bacterium]
ENRPTMLCHFLALNGLGASIVPINPDLRRAELEMIAGHCEPVIGIAVPDRVGDLAAVGGFPVLAQGEPLPRSDGGGAGQEVDAAREAAMLYTSGTTGGPKGCILSNRYFLEAGRWYANAGGLCALRDGERMLTPLPLFHMNALAYSVMATITVGGTLTVLDRFHPRSWWQSVREADATAIHYLGVMPAMLMGAPSSEDDRAHNVRFGFGANVEPQLHAPFEARFGFPLIEAWAMTETGAGACIAANNEPRRVGQKSFGRPGPEVEAMIAGGGDGPGELLVRRAGPDPRFGFFSGYHKDAAATEAAWEGGWFHTGDIVRREGADFIFVDRKKNVIRRSGENIAAVEVEAELGAHADVSAAGITAVADPLRGEEVFACVVSARRDEGFARELVGWALDEIAYYKVPGYVAFVDALPVTATQKIQRPALKALASELLPGAFDMRALKTRRR